MHGDTTCDRLAPVKKGSVVRRACVGAAGGRSVCAGCVCRSATRSKEFLNGHRRVCWHCAKRARRPELMIRREFFIYYIFTATAAAAFPYRSVRRVVRTIRAPKNTPPRCGYRSACINVYYGTSVKTTVQVGDGATVSIFYCVYVYFIYGLT